MGEIKTINVKFQIRRDTAANWASANPVLAAGEPAYAIDTGVQKIGDGVTAWSDLKPTNRQEWGEF